MVSAVLFIPKTRYSVPTIKLVYDPCEKQSEYDECFDSKGCDKRLP